MTKNNPWRTLSTRTAYSNPWMRVREDRVIRPDQQEGIYGVVETRIATGVVAVDEDKNIYLVGQYRYTTNSYSWEIIEGGADLDEPPLAAAMRELKEEAGITANKWTQLGGEVHLSNCISSEVAYIYLAQDLTFSLPAPEATEVLSIRKIRFKEAINEVDAGIITDAVSIIGILRATRLSLDLVG